MGNRFALVVLSLVAGQLIFCQEKTGSPILASSLPIIAINTNNTEIPDEPKIEARMGILNDQSGVNILYPDYSHDTILIGIEIRGQSSQYLYPKKSFGLETRDINGENLNISILGLAEENDWVLYGPYGDKTLLRNKLVYDLAGEIMEWAPNFEFCELVVNNEYMGIYLFGEKIKRDKNRIDIAKLTDNDISGDDLTGGYIIKIDKGDQNNFNGWYSSHSPAYPSAGKIFFQYHYPENDDILPEQKDYIQDFIGRFENTLIGPEFDDPDLGYSAYIDPDTFIDFFIINELSKNIDGYRLSTYFYKDKDSKDGRLKMGPVWDFNLAFGNADYCEGEQAGGWMYKYNEVCRGDYWPVPFWWERLLEDKSFRDRLKTRWTELSRTVLSKYYIESKIDAYIAKLGPAVNRNFNKWPIFGQWVWPNYFVGNNYQEEIDYLKDWIDNRLRFLHYNMPGEIITGKDDVVINETITVYPNPFQASFDLDGIVEPNRHNTVLKIFTSLGKQVLEIVIDRVPKNVDMNGMSKGIYYYFIEYDGIRQHTGKLVKNQN